MESYKTRPIGEKFDYDGTTLEVVENEHPSCADCYFGSITCCRFDEIIDITGDCIFSKRKDRKDVIFKEVEE